RVRMLTDQQRLAGPLRASEHIAHAVDRAFQSCRLVLRLQPAPRLHVLRAERGTHHADSLRADAAQVAEVGEETVAIDVRHGAILLEAVRHFRPPPWPGQAGTISICRGVCSSSLGSRIGFIARNSLIISFTIFLSCWVFAKIC